MPNLATASLVVDDGDEQGGLLSIGPPSVCSEAKEQREREQILSAETIEATTQGYGGTENGRLAVHLKWGGWT